MNNMLKIVCLWVNFEIASREITNAVFVYENVRLDPRDICCNGR